MADTCTLYHNPRCSKSRQTLALLEARGIAPAVVNYLQSPPDADTLEALLGMLALEPRDLMRRKEPEYAANNLDDDNKTRAELIQAMIDHPILIERPIVVSGGRAVIGRPPENVLALV